MKFVIPKGQPFYCEFTVKEPGAGVPQDLTGATGTFNLSTIGPDTCIVLQDILLSFPDPINGLASVSLTADQTKDLITQLGFPEDGYPMVATYKASLDIITVDYPIYVLIPQVYISDDGTSCET